MQAVFVCKAHAFTHSNKQNYKGGRCTCPQTVNILIADLIPQCHLQLSFVMIGVAPKWKQVKTHTTFLKTKRKTSSSYVFTLFSTAILHIYTFGTSINHIILKLTPEVHLNRKEIDSYTRVFWILASVIHTYVKRRSSCVLNNFYRRRKNIFIYETREISWINMIKSR